MTATHLWTDCQGEEAIAPLKCSAYRVVEAQHISSSRKLVDSVHEQEVLENLLESYAKPALPQTTEFQGLHYLLVTPFRYPPLPHGSRFSSRLYRSLWYGSLLLETAFAEVAFYRLLFFKGTSGALKSAEIQLSAYQAKIATKAGVSLEKPLFNRYTALISCKDNYQHSQTLGAAMRNANVAAFTYYSARMPDTINIGIFTPAAFADKSPILTTQQTWICYTEKERIEFTRGSLLEKPQHWVFTQENFTDNNVLPFDHRA
jgi:hypothetical protein